MKVCTQSIQSMKMQTLTVMIFITFKAISFALFHNKGECITQAPDEPHVLQRFGND